MALRIPVLPNIPNPDDAAYKNNPVAWQRALYQALQNGFGQLNKAAQQNQTPLNQSYAVSSYSTNTALSGTSTGTDVANFVCSLVQSMTSKGIIKPA